MYFQALDDKKDCIGIYTDGHLIFDNEKMCLTYHGVSRIVILGRIPSRTDAISRSV